MLLGLGFWVRWLWVWFSVVREVGKVMKMMRRKRLEGRRYLVTSGFESSFGLLLFKEQGVGHLLNTFSRILFCCYVVVGFGLQSRLYPSEIRVYM